MRGSNPADKGEDNDSFKTESDLGEDEEQPVKQSKQNNINTPQHTLQSSNNPKDSIISQQKVKPKKIKKKPTKEELDKKDQKSQKLKDKKRYGQNIKFENYKTSDTIKIICMVLIIIIIPLQIFLQRFLTEVEKKMIINVQKSFGNSTALINIFSIPLKLVRPDATMFFMEFLYLTTDSLLAFKTSIITCFGYYILTCLKMMYKDARPFWLSNDITGFSCRFDFGDPSYHLYTLTTFWVYNIIMYKMKYAEKVNKQLVYTMFGGLLVFSLFLMIAAIHQGTTFLYQEFMGLLYGGIFLVAVMNFDKVIHRRCEKVAFQLETSRRDKFYLLFICFGLYTLLSVYQIGQSETWITPLEWMKNSGTEEQKCRDELFRHSQNTIGLSQTFHYVNILFFIIGMTFGTSYSIQIVDPIDWVHTKLVKRLIRGFLGVGIAMGFYFLMYLITPADQATVFIVHKVTIALVSSFFIYGLFPIICQKINLVDSVKDLEDIKSKLMSPSSPTKEEDEIVSQSKRVRILAE